MIPENEHDQILSPLYMQFYLKGSLHAAPFFIITTRYLKQLFPSTQSIGLVHQRTISRVVSFCRNDSMLFLAIVYSSSY
jgi:hypothetical protein